MTRRLSSKSRRCQTRRRSHWCLRKASLDGHASEAAASSSGQRHDEVDWGFVPLVCKALRRASVQEADRRLLRAWPGEEEGRARRADRGGGGAEGAAGRCQVAAQNRGWLGISSESDGSKVEFSTAGGAGEGEGAAAGPARLMNPAGARLKLQARGTCRQLRGRRV